MITHVAIKYEGEVWSLPPPNRHCHVIWDICAKLGINQIGDDEEQGFLDSEGNFLNREEALIIALANNQIKDPNDIRANQLFSEDLW